MSEEGLKFVLHDGNQSLGLKFPFLLLPPEQMLFFEECGSKKNSVIALSTGRGKVVFALLDEVIAIYIGLTLIHVGGYSLKKFFSGFIIIISSRGLEL